MLEIIKVLVSVGTLMIQLFLLGELLMLNKALKNIRRDEKEQKNTHSEIPEWVDEWIDDYMATREKDNHQ